MVRCNVNAFSVFIPQPSVYFNFIPLLRVQECTSIFHAAKIAIPFSHLSNWYENKDFLGALLKEERESNRGMSFKMWLCSPESHQVIEIWRMVGKRPLIMNSLRSTGKHCRSRLRQLWKLKISRCRKVLQTSKRTAKSYSCLIWLTAYSSHTVSLISYPSLIENYT